MLSTLVRCVLCCQSSLFDVSKPSVLTKVSPMSTKKLTVSRLKILIQNNLTFVVDNGIY